MPPTTAGPATLDELSVLIDGFMVRPGDDAYETTRLLQNTAFDESRPAAIVLAAGSADVALTITFARSQGMQLAVRSGGHSYGGWSTCPGIVIDTRALTGVSVDPATGTAEIGAGAALIDVYTTLAASGVTLAAGSCPTVGIAGLTLGGGHGLTGRAYGLTCDQLAAVEIVTADGVVHHCDAQADADLFWACRGGGGGSFGVVTSFTFNVHPVPTDATAYVIKYSWRRAADALAAWAAWVPSLPDQTTSLARLEGTPQLVVAGLHLGPLAEARALLAPITTNAASVSVKSHDFVEAQMLEAGCAHTSVAACHTEGISAGGTLPRATPFAASSHYFAELTTDTIHTAMDAVDAHTTSVGNRAVSIQFDAYGGAINRIAPDATAFVHRTAFCSAQYASFSAGDLPADRAWAASTRLALEPFSNGESYQNYSDPDRDDWAFAYYGANLARLQQIKRSFDPGNVFSFTQSIPL